MFYIAREVEFTFHNQIKCNETRGFSLLIIPIYSETMKNNLSLITEKFKEQIKKLKLENPKSFDLVVLDINPFIGIQSIKVNIKENVIDCAIIAILNTPKGKNVKIFIGQSINKEKVHINCSAEGISNRE